MRRVWETHHAWARFSVSLGGLDSWQDETLRLRLD
jgi:hypothetical protein